MAVEDQLQLNPIRIGGRDRGTDVSFYFDQFEDRKPPEPLPYSVSRELLWQFFATINICVAVWYIHWRWTESLNWDALWFSIPLVVAESLAVIGTILFTFNLWAVRDTKRKSPPSDIQQCVRNPDETPSRPVSVDVFFPTYDEDPELVRLSILDAKALNYPSPIDVRIHVLDDGSRDEMAKVASEESVAYITRTGNEGFKAGNMRNAMEKTSGDFIVICDADTRPFPTLLENTLGYFRDSQVAWVQTPQWFFDVPEGARLHALMERKLGVVGRWAGKLLEGVLGPITLGRDPFVNDPQMFYDIIQRRRNWANASFCCGAGSIHRREAVLEAALKTYSEQIRDQVDQIAKDVDDADIRSDLEGALTHQVVQETEFTPYKFHVSEDIYTSIVLHSDQERRWKSVFHPNVESKMLSPQDLETWTIQRFKYAGGSLDIAIHDNPLLRPGLSLSQRILYAGTFFSYLACVWNIVFLVAPAVYLFTGIAPISAYSMDFFRHFVPFVFMNELAFMIGTWGISAWDGKASYLYFFPVNFRALWTVIRGEEIRFPTTAKDRKDGTYGHLVVPQLAVIGLTLAGLAWCGARIYTGAEFDSAAVLSNAFWGLNNVMMMMGIVFAAYWRPNRDTPNKVEPCRAELA